MQYYNFSKALIDFFFFALHIASPILLQFCTTNNFTEIQECYAIFFYIFFLFIFNFPSCQPISATLGVTGVCHCFHSMSFLLTKFNQLHLFFYLVLCSALCWDNQHCRHFAICYVDIGELKIELSRDYWVFASHCANFSLRVQPENISLRKKNLCATLVNMTKNSRKTHSPAHLMSSRLLSLVQYTTRCKHIEFSSGGMNLNSVESWEAGQSVLQRLNVEFKQQNCCEKNTMKMNFVFLHLFIVFIFLLNKTLRSLPLSNPTSHVDVIFSLLCANFNGEGSCKAVIFRTKTQCGSRQARLTKTFLLFYRALNSSIERASHCRLLVSIAC